MSISDTDLVVTETPIGYWNYHLSMKSNKTVSLCGKQVMESLIPLKYYRSRLGKIRQEMIDGTACQKCAEIAWNYKETHG